jgi:flavin-dependent dehydrogenase
MALVNTYDVLIIGGGLAGLTTALHLSKHPCRVLLIEKYTYPNHKVCGEYVSNEVLPYLRNLGVDPLEHGAQSIMKFEISNKNGAIIRTELPLGGFGISRYTFDDLLFKALIDKVEVVFDTVEGIEFHTNLFKVTTQTKKSFEAEFVVGAFGKRSNLDTFMRRKFILKPSPWLAVKAHYEYNFPNDTVALHNFDGGYCGLSMTEMNVVNACYLVTYKSFKRFGNIPVFQKQVVSQNPYLEDFFREAKPLFPKPLTISQISFDSKQAVENHVFMIGDSAGLIHPLCGNGMSMAIHSAKLFCEIYLKAYKKGSIDRKQLENDYMCIWTEAFSKRLKTGRRIQTMLLHPGISAIGFSMVKLFPSIVSKLIKKTHGEPLS